MSQQIEIVIGNQNSPKTMLSRLWAIEDMQDVFGFGNWVLPTVWVSCDPSTTGGRHPKPVGKTIVYLKNAEFRGMRSTN